MKKLVYISVVVLVSFAYLGLPAALLSYAPLKYESATLYFDRAPKDGLESLQVPQSLKDEISLFQCRAVQPDEVGGARAAAILSCILVSKRNYQGGVVGIFLQQPGWDFPRLVTEIKAGVALWPSTIPFPFAQIGLQILFVLIVAGAVLRGELGRFTEVFRRPGKLVLLLLPAGILALRVLLVSGLSGEHQSALFRDCDIGRIDYGSLVLMLLVAPIAEELLFRGWAYAFLERVYSTRWVIAITSIVFAAMHYDPVIGITSWISLANAFFYVCMGVALGYIRYRTSSVTMCIGAHFFSNLLTTFVRIC